jgi:membrane-bound ClpP family serine protease
MKEFGIITGIVAIVIFVIGGLALISGNHREPMKIVMPSVIVIDHCQYIAFEQNNHYLFYIHKANCTNRTEH